MVIAYEIVADAAHAPFLLFVIGEDDAACDCGDCENAGDCGDEGVGDGR